MLFPLPAQLLNKGRADFKVVEFRKLIQQKGLNITWEQALECPCSIKSSTNYGLDLLEVVDSDVNSSGYAPDCTICNGIGIVRHSAQTIKALITSASGEEVSGKYGLLKQEKIKITTEPEHLLSYGDRITLKDSVIVFRETLKMPNAGVNITPSRPIITRNLNLASGETPVGVLYIQKSGVDGLGIAGGVNQEDIQINAGGASITFLNGSEPAAGTNLTISYYANPTYVIIEYPHTLRDTFLRTNNQEVFSPMLVQAEAKMEVDK
jgi:hypothetical protein